MRDRSRHSGDSLCSNGGTTLSDGGDVRQNGSQIGGRLRAARIVVSNRTDDEINDDRWTNAGVVIVACLTLLITVLTGGILLDVATESVEPAPLQASLSVGVDTGSNVLSVHHAGGDALTVGRSRITVTIAGHRLVLEPAAQTGALEAGETARIDLATGRVDWDPDVDRTEFAVGKTTSIEAGDTVFVEIVDAETEQTVFETSLTV